MNTGQLATVCVHWAVFYSEPLSSTKGYGERRINKGEIVVIVSGEMIDSEYQVLSSIGIGWVAHSNITDVKIDAS
jgi:hypothetical protein